MKINQNVINAAIILFIEGLVSLSYQMLYIRQIGPIVGNSVDVISWIIGIFLIALAIGYKHGGNYKGDFNEKIIYNIIIAAFFATIGLSYLFLNAYFNFIGQITGYYFAMIIYCLIIVAPATYYLGQTLPLMTNRNIGENVSEISGNILFLSTIGSFLGAILTTNVFLKFFGVSITTMLVTLLLLSLYFIVPKTTKNNKIFCYVMILAFISILNFVYEKSVFIKTNQYANYEINKFTTKDNNILKLFKSNNSYSSMLIKKEAEDSDFRTFGYIKEISDFMLVKKQFKNKDILVIGAGGFVLSYGVINNNFTFVDIDPQIKEIAEKNFLEKKINGKFIAKDGRAYINESKIKYDAIISDAYSGAKSIPESLTTVEYFRKLKQSVKDNGWVILNIIQSSDFSDNYSRNIKSTIDRVFPYCFVEILKPEMALSNVIYFCNVRKEKQEIYTDDLNNSNSDYYKNTFKNEAK